MKISETFFIPSECALNKTMYFLRSKNVQSPWSKGYFQLNWVLFGHFYPIFGLVYSLLKRLRFVPNYLYSVQNRRKPKINGFTDSEDITRAKAVDFRRKMDTLTNIRKFWFPNSKKLWFLGSDGSKSVCWVFWRSNIAGNHF